MNDTHDLQPESNDPGATEAPQTRAERLASEGGARRAPAKSGGVLGSIRETALVAAIALAVSLLVKTFLAQMFWIPSESMQNTLEVKDRVVVSKLTPTPFGLERGDVVVFNDSMGWMPSRDTSSDSLLVKAAEFVGLMPSGADKHLIKRVIGLPGDHVVCCDAQGRVSVNDEPLDETYLFAGDQPSTIDFDITVPDGKIWVMGDHRSDSGDSRWHDNNSGGQEGSVPLSAVTGRAEWLVWPLDRLDTLDDQGVFDTVPDPR